MRGPHIFLVATGAISITRKGIEATVAWPQAFLHSLGIYEELEGGARLTKGSNLVILPEIEVNIAHPSPYLARIWLHSNETAVEETDHVTNRVHRRELTIDGAVIGEQFHFMRLVHVKLHAIRLIGEAFQELLIMIGLLGDIIDEVGNLPIMLVAPRILTMPMLIETVLQHPHLLHRRLFGIALHARVDRGVYLQPVNIEVEPFVAISGNKVLTLPAVYILLALLTPIPRYHVPFDTLNTFQQKIWTELLHVIDN